MRDEMRSIASVLGEMLESEGLRDLKDLLAIKDSWARVAGEALAEKTAPYRLQRGRLFVGVDSHAILQDALFRVEGMREAIREVLGLKIEEIIVRKINLK